MKGQKNTAYYAIQRHSNLRPRRKQDPQTHENDTSSGPPPLKVLLLKQVFQKLNSIRRNVLPLRPNIFTCLKTTASTTLCEIGKVMGEGQTQELPLEETETKRHQYGIQD